MASRAPRYAELARELRDAIRRGEWATGAQLPTETALTTRYGVSRFTVREALRRLQAEGLIRRRRGSGTVVAEPASGALRASISNVGELLQYAHDTRFIFEPLGEAALGVREARELERQPGERWLRFAGRRLRREDDAVIGLTRFYILPEHAEAAAGLAPTGEAIFEQMERLGGIKVARVTQDIRAVAADESAAAALAVRRGSPCLSILRCYLDRAGRMVEIALTTHPGDRFTYSVRTEVE